MSKVIHIDPENPSAEVINLAATVLRDGGIVVFPTETVYGIGASATSCVGAAGDHRHQDASARPSPLPWLVEDDDALDRYGVDVPEYAHALAERVLARRAHARRQGLRHRRPRLPRRRAARSRFAARTTRSSRSSSARAAGPIITTSANTSGLPPRRSFDELEERIIAAADVALDGGETRTRLASTVVDCTGPEPVVTARGSRYPRPRSWPRPASGRLTSRTRIRYNAAGGLAGRRPPVAQEESLCASTSAATTPVSPLKEQVKAYLVGAGPRGHRRRARTPRSRSTTRTTREAVGSRSSPRRCRLRRARVRHRSRHGDRRQQGARRARRAGHGSRDRRAWPACTTTRTCVTLAGRYIDAGTRRGDPRRVPRHRRSRAAATSAGSTRSARIEREHDDAYVSERGTRGMALRYIPAAGPGARRRHRRRAGAPARHDRAHRVGELHLAGRARGRRHGAHQQVRRGPSRQALLRRLREGRRRRGPRARPRQGALRRRPRQRPAARRRAGEPRRLLRRAASPATRSSA